MNDQTSKKRKLKKLLRQEKGQALVEFALVLPILLILVLGIVVFGQIFFSYQLIQNAARDGARYGTVGSTDAEIMQIVQQKMSTLKQENITVTIQPTEGSRQRGEQIDVTIDYQVELYAPMWANILPNPYPISVKTVMRIE